MLFLYVSNIFIKYAFISKTRANSAKIRPFSESAHLIYLKTVEISSAKICVLTSVIITVQFSAFPLGCYNYEGPHDPQCFMSYSDYVGCTNPRNYEAKNLDPNRKIELDKLNLRSVV